jgi:hypothetical protein
MTRAIHDVAVVATKFARCRTPLAVAVLAIGLSGCGMSSLTSGFGGGVLGGGSAGTSANAGSDDQLISSAKIDVADGGGGDVAHGCPRIVVGGKDASLTIYESGRVGDSLAVMHRGDITKTARECSIEPGRVTVKYGLSGRVLMGPRGQPGSYSLPLTAVVKDAKRENVTLDKARVDVALSREKPIGYFNTVRTVTFVIPEGTRPGEYEVHVGFDQGVPGAG